jgi:aspartate kinase
VLGACLLADEIEIWTDVDGVLTADPRVVPAARVLPSLSYEDAGTLATFGAKVLHPKTIEPAASRDIPVRVLNSQRPAEPGTRIDALGGDASGCTAIASRGGLCLLELTARHRWAAVGFSARALQCLADGNVNVVLGEVHRDRVSVAVDRTFDVEAVTSRVAAFAHVRVRHGLSAVCAVGEPVATDPRAVMRALALCHDGPIHLMARPGGASAFAVLVDEEHAPMMVVRLHAAFIPESVEAREGVAS